MLREPSETSPESDLIIPDVNCRGGLAEIVCEVNAAQIGTFLITLVSMRSWIIAYICAELSWFTFDVSDG